MRKEILEKIINSKRNNIISGEMSTGKTTNIGFGIVKKLIEKKDNLFILDTKEEYINKYYELLKNNGYNIIVINTKNPTKSNGWNPIEYSKMLFKSGLVDDSIKYLNDIAEELFYDSSDLDPFWSNMANNFFKGIALSLYNDAKDNEINLRSINSIVMDADVDSNYLEEYFRTKNKADAAYICAAPTVFCQKETRGGIISTAMSKLNPVVRDNSLSLLLNKTTYSYDELLKNKTAIFYIADEMDNTNCLVSMYLKELFNILCNNDNKNNFNIILDNFDYINNITDFNKMLSVCIRYNIKFYIFTRDKDKLENSYSNYINKLANNIIVDENKIDLIIGRDITTIPNKEIKDNYAKSNIEYPILDKMPIEIFNLKKFIIENIKIDNNECDNYVLELGNINKDSKYADELDKNSILNGDAKYYLVKDEDKVIDSFIIYNEDNKIVLDNKRLIDIEYLNFIFDNLNGYDYVTIYTSKNDEHILNILKFNFDIDSCDEVNGMIKIKINI